MGTIWHTIANLLTDHSDCNVGSVSVLLFQALADFDR